MIQRGPNLGERFTCRSVNFGDLEQVIFHEWPGHLVLAYDGAVNVDPGNMSVAESDGDGGWWLGGDVYVFRSTPAGWVLEPRGTGSG